MEGIRTERVSFGKRTAKRFDSISDFLNEIGVSFAAMIVEVFKFVGVNLLSLADIYCGGIFIGWVVSQLTPPEFVIYGKIFGWVMSVSVFLIISALWSNWESTKQSTSGFSKVFAFAFPLVLNLVDSFIDSGNVIILFGQGDALLNNTLRISEFSLMEWFMLGSAFLISFLAEKWRIDYIRSRKSKKTFSDFEQ